MESLTHLNFLRPEWFFVLPFWWLAVGWAMMFPRWQKNMWRHICDPVLLDFLLRDHKENTSSTNNKFLGFLSMLLGSLIILALAGPAWHKLPQPIFKKESAWVVVMDLSRSMDAQDLSPSRLVVMQRKVEDFLRLSNEGQVGLIVFAGSAFDVIPLTTDRHAISAVLKTLDTSMMPVQGSRASMGLKHAAAMLKRGKITQGSVLLLTDGVDSLAQKQAEKLANNSHRVYVLGIGTADGAPIPSKAAAKVGFLQDDKGNIIIPRLSEQTLMNVATAGQGGYQKIRLDDLDIQSWLDATHTTSLSMENKQKQLTQQWQEEGPWILIAVAPFMLLAFRRGFLQIFLAVILISSVLPATGYAKDEEPNAKHWFLNADQIGQQALQKGEPEKAAEHFENKAWKAAAFYRAGNYAESAKLLAGIDSAEALYNRGNALAKSGALNEAMQAYQQALKLSPQHEDAQFNLELLKKLQQQQRDQSDKDSKQQDDKQKQDKQDQAQQDESQQGQSSDEQQSDSGEGKQQQKQKQGQQGDSKTGDDNDASQKNKPADSAQDAVQKDKEEALKKYNQALQDKEQPDGEEKQAQQIKQQQQNDAKKENKEAQIIQQQAEPLTTEQMEQQQAQQQWLRKIPDDPGGLLRRKFRYQYQQQAEKKQSTQQDIQPW